MAKSITAELIDSLNCMQKRHAKLLIYTFEVVYIGAKRIFKLTMSTLETQLVRDKKENNKEIENDAINVHESMTELNSITEIQFLICPSCFWCASYINRSSSKDYETLNQCVMCKNSRIESIPIRSDESYKVNHNQAYGIELTFQRRKNIV